tara:strand:+ start:835 stop:1029 length:195 start_codon:yes stop_codon:yes gene_type:complete
MKTMPIGSLVKYKPWYEGPQKTGIVLTSTGAPKPNDNITKEFVLVMWENAELEWEEVAEIEVIQ